MQRVLPHRIFARAHACVHTLLHSEKLHAQAIPATRVGQQVQAHPTAQLPTCVRQRWPQLQSSYPTHRPLPVAQPPACLASPPPPRRPPRQRLHARPAPVRHVPAIEPKHCVFQSMRSGTGAMLPTEQHVEQAPTGWGDECRPRVDLNLDRWIQSPEC